MKDAIPEERLLGRWVHAHEEDREGLLVFRRFGASLPPSRGRREFELRPRGVLLEQRIAAADGHEEHGGTWRLDRDVLELKSTSQPDQRMRVVSADDDRLVVEIKTAG